MTERHVSYALIALHDGEVGIFTDRDLRTRVVAAGLPVAVPIGRVMSAPARTRHRRSDGRNRADGDARVRAAAHAGDDDARRGVGVLEDADLLAASARQSFMLRRSIGLAADATELQAAAQRVTHTAMALFRSGTKASATSGNPVHRRRQRGAKGARTRARRSLSRTGHADSGFAWLTLGSIARREAMPSSDVDSALSWRDELSSSSGQLRAMASAHPRHPRRLWVCPRIAMGRSPRVRISRVPKVIGPPQPGDGSTTR